MKILSTKKAYIMDNECNHIRTEKRIYFLNKLLITLKISQNEK